MAFSFHQLRKRASALCACSRTKNCAKKLEGKVAKQCVRNFCSPDTSSSISIFSVPSTKISVCENESDAVTFLSDSCALLTFCAADHAAGNARSRVAGRLRFEIVGLGVNND